MENGHILLPHWKWWFSSAMFNCQRVPNAHQMTGETMIAELHGGGPVDFQVPAICGHLPVRIETTSDPQANLGSESHWGSPSLCVENVETTWNNCNPGRRDLILNWRKAGGPQITHRMKMCCSFVFNTFANNMLISLQNINETHSMNLCLYCMKLCVYCHAFLSPCKNSETTSCCFVEINKR